MIDASERVRKAIEKSNLSYMELEKLTGVSHSTLQRFAIGKTNRLPLSAVEKLALVTNTTPAYLMGWEDEVLDMGEKIKHRRKELHLTMLDIAKKTGVSEATVSRWESGDIANMRRDKIATLATALQVSPAYLMGWDDDDIVPD